MDESLAGGVKYVWNHVTVTGIEENTKYYYTVEKNGVETEPAKYTAKSFSEVKLLYVGDPQIGASKGQPQNGEKLTETSGAANTAARNDSFAWNRTLEAASRLDPDLSFIISAGDQVNDTGKSKEEYAGYLSPEPLKSLPLAATIGSHDSLDPDYKYHFDSPNASEYGKTEAGGDYRYSCGEGLFIVLNTNNYNAAQHEKAIAEAVESDPDAIWRVVTIHQDIYGTGLDRSDTDGTILRTQLTPIFDKYDIDVVLQGHDHTCSRSKLLYGDGQTHSGYEFQLNTDGSDYDWDHAYNVTEGEQIPLAPSDTEGSALLAAFQTDDLCCSVITITGTSFAIDTYQITDRGDVESIDTTFSIVKDASKPANTPAALASAATLEADGVNRLRDVAWSVRGSDAQFNVTWAAETGPVIITGKACNDHRPVDSCSGELAAMSVTVDGKPVTAQAIMAGGNWFVSADFLASPGVKVG